MRVYNVTAAAFAFGSSSKWVDNLLSHHRVPGVERGARGRERKLPHRTLLLIAIARELVQRLGIPLADALAIAQVVATGAGRAEYVVSPAISLHIDVAAIERELAARLADAMETSVKPRRGRPPLRRRVDEVF